MARSRILKLDGGRNSATDGVNVDIAAVPGVDVVADVSEEWPFERALFDRIEAHHVLDHIPHDDLPTVLYQDSDKTRDNGGFYAEAPLAHSWSARNDPTHLSIWYWLTPMGYTTDDELSYEVRVEARLVLEHRNICLFVTSDKWYVRQPSWLLKQWLMRDPSLIELVTSSYVMGVLEFTMRKRG